MPSRQYSPTSTGALARPSWLPKHRPHADSPPTTPTRALHGVALAWRLRTASSFGMCWSALRSAQ